MTPIAKIQVLVGREIPKILGSSTAFIVVVVVLVATIIVSFSAIIYFLRKERTGDELRRRYNVQPRALVDRDFLNPWKNLRLWGSRSRHNHARLDKSMGHSEMGWIQENGREWNVEDGDLAEDLAMPSSEDNQSGQLRMSEKRSSASFTVGLRAYMHDSTSDDASSECYDPHDVHGLSYYPEQFPTLPQPTIPSVELESYHSPASSPPPSSPVSRRITKSPEPISNTLSQDSDPHDSVRDHPLPQFVAPPPVKVGSGTKFFEAF